MRTLAAVTLLSLAALAAPRAGRLHAQERPTTLPSPAQDRRVDERRALASDGAVKILSRYGSVSVVGWDRDSVAITGVLGPDERLVAGGDQQGMKAIVERDTERTTRGAHLTVRVPAGARVWVRTASAEVQVSGVTGGLDVQTVGASIRVLGSPRELSAETMNGSVVVDGSPAWLRTKTATGAITVRGSSADARLATVSGAVRAEGGQFAQLAVESVTGRVTVSGAVTRGGSLTVDSHAGDVELRLARPLLADLHATSVTSRVENHLTAARPAAARGAIGSELRFTVGDHAPRVTVRSFKGQVVLRPVQ